MWVKTHNGNFCNLGRATDITLSREPITKKLEIHAYFEGQFVDRSGELEQNETLIATFEKDEDAEQYMKGLGLNLKAAACKLREDR